jgi:PST family polysaccharide transporter
LFLGSFETFSAYKRLLLLLMFSGIGEVLFPVWFFQGTENLKPATIIVFLTRLFLLIGTVIFVNSQYDLLSYILLFVSSSLLMGGSGIFYLFKYYNIRIVLLPINKLIHYFRESLPFFIGRFLSLVFNFGTIFFIGKFCLLEQVTGFYTGLKIVMLGVIPFEMLQQAVFPTISRTKNKKLLKNLVYVSFIVGVFIGSIIFLMADYFMVWFGGQEMLQFAPSLKLLAILSPFVSLTFILGTCSLVAFGFYREYNFSLIFTSIVYILILIVLFFTGKINFWNLIYLRVFGDVLMALIRLFYSFKRKTIIA